MKIGKRGAPIVIALIIASILSLWSIPSLSSTALGDDADHAPPTILTRTINETITTPDWYHEIRAADNETPEEFLTFSITSVDTGSWRYLSMQGNLLVASSLPSYYDSISLTVEVMDTDGLTDSVRYSIAVDIENRPPVITRSDPNLVVKGLNAYFTVGTGPQCDVRYFDPEGEPIDLNLRDPDHMTVYDRRSEEEGVDYRVEVRRGWDHDEYYNSIPFVGWSDLVIEFDDGPNTVLVTMRVVFMPFSDTFWIVPLVDIGNLTDRDPVILGIGMVGVEGVLFQNLSSVYWDSNRTSIDDEYSPIMKDVLSAGHHTITVEFDLTDDDSSSEYEVYMHIYVHPSEERVERTENVGGEVCLFGLLSLVFLPLIIVSPAVIGSIILRVIRRRGDGK